MITEESGIKPLVAQLAVTSGSQFVSSSVPVLAALALLGFAPTVLVYVLAQRQIIRGITAGAIK
jgi:ABC-type glycerol-3-phosphate transport system permease component